MSGKEKRAFDPLRFFARLNRSIRKRILRRKFGEEWNTQGRVPKSQIRILRGVFGTPKSEARRPTTLRITTSNSERPCASD